MLFSFSSVWESCNTGDDKFTDVCKAHKPVECIIFFSYHTEKGLAKDKAQDLILNSPKTRNSHSLVDVFVICILQSYVNRLSLSVA